MKTKIYTYKEFIDLGIYGHNSACGEENFDGKYFVEFSDLAFMVNTLEEAEKLADSFSHVEATFYE